MKYSTAWASHFERFVQNSGFKFSQAAFFERFVQLALVAAGSAGFAACAVVEFPDKSTIALDNLSAKTWQTAVFLEQDIYNPGTYAGSAGSRTLNGFALASSGFDAYIALTLYDPSSARFEGYARTYRDGTGWVTGAAGFQRVATSTTAFGFGAPWVTATADGRATAGFWAATDAAGTSLAITRRGSRWGRAQLSTVTDGGLACQVGWGTTNGSFFDLDTNTTDLAAHHGFGTGTASYLAPDGRLYLFYANASSDELKLEVVDPASTVNDTGVDYGFGSTLSGGVELRHVEAVSDGEGRLCYFHESEELGARQVVSRCLDLTTGGVSILPDPMTDPSNAVTTLDSHGFAAASDSAGTILSVQYENTTSDGYEPTYSVFQDGAWVATSGLFDSANASLETPADNATYPEAYPVVAHIAESYWAAVWVRLDTTALTETIYTALYDLEEDTWSEAVVLAELDYVVRPRVESLTLVGNHTGDLVLAARFVSVQDTAGTTEDDQRRTMAWRYNSQLGWLSSQVVGQGCKPADATRLGECTQPVQAALLPSGNALIVFPDQDPSGLTRPAASEFK